MLAQAGASVGKGKIKPTKKAGSKSNLGRSIAQTGVVYVCSGFSVFLCIYIQLSTFKKKELLARYLSNIEPHYTASAREELVL